MCANTGLILSIDLEDRSSIAERQSEYIPLYLDFMLAVVCGDWASWI